MKWKQWRSILGVAMSLGAIACASDPEPSVGCGAGTELKAGKCVPTAVKQTTCGDKTKLVDGACVVDFKALRPAVSSVVLSGITAAMPEKSGFLVLHSTLVRAKLTLDAERFDTELVVGVRSADGAKQCSFGLLPVSYEGNTKGAPQTIEVQGRLLVQDACKELVGAKNATLYASFDPFLDTEVAGRKEPTATDLNAVIAASVLPMKNCTDLGASAASVSGGHVHSTVVACDHEVAVLANPGRDLTIHGTLSFGDKDMDADAEADGPNQSGSSGGVVLEVEAFDKELVDMITKPAVLPLAATQVQLAKPPTFAELNGTGNSTPVVYGMAHYIIYGVGKDEKVDGDDISVAFDLRPKGKYDNPDEGWMAMPSKISTEAKAGEEPTIEEVKEMFLQSLQGIDPKSLQMPLYFTTELREMLTVGGWRAFDIFEIRGCVKAAFAEKGGDRVKENNCQLRPAIVVRKRVYPSTGSMAMPADYGLAQKAADVPTEKIPDQNPGGNHNLKPMEASLPGAGTLAFEKYGNLGSNIGSYGIKLGMWGFVNLRESSGEVRLAEMLTGQTIPKSAGVYGMAVGEGAGTVPSIVRWGTEPTVGAELLVARLWDQPVNDGTFGTLDWFKVIVAAYAMGYEVFDFGFPLPLPNIGIPNEMTLAEATFLKVLSATVATPGENKNGLKFFLTAGLSKTPGDKKAGKKGTVNKSQSKDLNRPDKVAGLVEIKFTANVGVEASITMERKTTSGSLPVKPIGALPSRCVAGNGVSWINADKSICYFASSSTSGPTGTWSACAKDGGKPYSPSVIASAVQLVDYRWNIHLDNTLAPMLSALGKTKPTKDQILAHAWKQPDPLAWVVNLPGALAVRAARADDGYWPLPSVVYGSGSSDCPSTCQATNKTASCRWDSRCTVTGLYHDAASEAARFVTNGLSKDSSDAEKSSFYFNYPYSGTIWTENVWVSTGLGGTKVLVAQPSTTVGDDQVWSTRMLSHWVKSATWWQVARTGAHKDHFNAWAGRLDLARTESKRFMTNGNPDQWSGLTSEWDSKDPMWDLMKSVPRTWDWLGSAMNGYRYRQHGASDTMTWQTPQLIDATKRKGLYGRISVNGGDQSLRGLCTASASKLGGEEAETFSIIMTPGSEASGAVSFGLGSTFLKFGADLSAIVYEFAMPFEFRALRTKDNKKAELGVTGKANLDLFKLKLKVKVDSAFGIAPEWTLIDMENGLVSEAWELFKPVIKSFGCGGTSCGEIANE